MAFDAGFLYAVLSEIREKALGGRIEKVTQPQKDEIVLHLRTRDGAGKLLINAGSSNPRIGLTDLTFENPAQPPMLCMLLRKHLNGSTLSGLVQFGFERACALIFDTRDEMGFPCRKKLIVECMGKYSNLMFTDENDKILSVLHAVDFTTSSLRQVLPGMTYELPPAQNKKDPLQVSKDGLNELFAEANPEIPVWKYLNQTFQGLAPAVCREIAYRATGDSEVSFEKVNPEKLSDVFVLWFDDLKNARLDPCCVFEGRKTLEYSYQALTYLASVPGVQITPAETPGQALDMFFSAREKQARTQALGADLIHLLSRTESRLVKKIQVQESERADCEKGLTYKKYADLITNNIYLLQKGASSARLTDYVAYDEATGAYGTCDVPLDTQLTPAANAQKYYKKYTKSQHAQLALTEQLALAQQELTYIRSVEDALSRAESISDISAIREELTISGYQGKARKQMSRKESSLPPLRYRSPNGFLILCGRNNIQNDRLSFREASRFDYWFHVKDAPGSHVILVTDGKEPGDEDYTAACQVAAVNSKLSDSAQAPVDYTLVRNLKKPPASKPGFVIFHTNWTAYVTPDSDLVSSMRETK